MIRPSRSAWPVSGPGRGVWRLAARGNQERLVAL